MNFRPRWRRREIMGFGEPWRVIHSLPCTNSPVIHPQALRPPLPVCLPHSARLTFLPPKCIYISPPSSGSTLPHTWDHVQEGGGGMKGKGETLPVSPQPLPPTPPPPPNPVVEVSVRDSPSHPGSPACLKETTLSRELISSVEADVTHNWLISGGKSLH